MARLAEGPFYVDSNVFLYAAIGDRVFGPSCAGILRRIARSEMKATTSSLALLEFANALRKIGVKLRPGDAVQALRSLPMPIQGLSAEIAEAGSNLAQATGKGPYDCTHAEVMRAIGLSKIISADKDFDSLPGITRLDPIDFRSA